MKFLFTIKIKDGASEQDYINAWERGSAIIQSSEGAEGTVLYRKIGEPGTLLAIATWKSKEARDAAMERLAEAGLKTQKILDAHKEYGITNILGNYEGITSVGPGGISPKP